MSRGGKKKKQLNFIPGWIIERKRINGWTPYKIYDKDRKTNTMVYGT